MPTILRHSSSGICHCLTLLLAISTFAAAALPPELILLKQTYDKAVAERVAAPFDAALTALNTNYAIALDSAVTDAKKAGRLADVIAIESDKTAIAASHGPPDIDEETIPASLKKLRGIYRGQYTKLTETRGTNHQTILPAYLDKLKTLEATLTKADRVDEAKEVLGYREGLAVGVVAEIKPQTVKPVVPTVGTLPLKDGFVNTLEMKFAHVTGMKALMCIHPTRRKDYAVYAAEVSGVAEFWKKQQKDGIPISEGDDYPVVAVSWEDAKAFCAWLSKKEGRTYRLPTDREWSYAVGIAALERVTKNTTPASLNGKIPKVYPWGTQWPPPKGAGNFADTSWKEAFPGEKEFIAGYTDGFPTTSPVLSFKPNKFGLYDMVGNAKQWCEDWFDEAHTTRVLRGGSWHYSRDYLMLSSFRNGQASDQRVNVHGHYSFRVVVETGAL